MTPGELEDCGKGHKKIINSRACLCLPGVLIWKPWAQNYRKYGINKANLDKNMTVCDLEN